MFRKTCRAWLLAAAAASIPLSIAASGELGFSRSVSPRLIQHYGRLFGPGAGPRLLGWQNFVRAADIRGVSQGGGVSRGDLLGPVNGYFNRIPAVTDQAHWGVEDYWATPAETLASNGGDCEDYAIAKYFTLKELGVPIARLRLVYARTTRSRAAHMVLAYYPEPQADPLILDNLQGSIEPASERSDLIPVYSFNDEDLFFPQQGAPTVRLSATSNRKWKDLIDKLEREMAL